MRKMDCPGFQTAGVASGLKKNGKKDLGLIYSEVPLSVAAMFTRNLVKAAPVILDQQRTANGSCRAVIVNSGNANCCTGEQGMQDAISYADEGGKICDDNPDIQPGDCAYMYAIPAFVANESVATTFIDLNNQADNAAEGKPVLEKKKALQELYLALQPKGTTRIEAMAASLLRDGWASLQTAWQKVHKLESLHQDVICALEINQKRMVDNLNTLHARATTLPLLPENTDWLAVNLCNDGSINPETTAELNLAPEGADFTTLDEPGKQSLMQRAMVNTYCKWQYAQQHTTAEDCPRN